ncbi:hypothetical protein V6Z11_A05G140100 [Gossypium hirsutum]|uniref:Uncharacterized protein n=1 Tax=Gossypium tomentosum TaxID=34277 RepID=A0A5D2QEW8_GOSTO|nr:hypothetical protein ES332_A05G140900v1 [Gossypium tomentosum]
MPSLAMNFPFSSSLSSLESCSSRAHFLGNLADVITQGCQDKHQDYLELQCWWFIEFGFLLLIGSVRAKHHSDFS